MLDNMGVVINCMAEEGIHLVSASEQSNYEVIVHDCMHQAPQWTQRGGVILEVLQEMFATSIPTLPRMLFTLCMYNISM